MVGRKVSRIVIRRWLLSAKVQRTKTQDTEVYHPPASSDNRARFASGSGGGEEMAYGADSVAGFMT